MHLSGTSPASRAQPLLRVALPSAVVDAVLEGHAVRVEHAVDLVLERRGVINSRPG